MDCYLWFPNNRPCWWARTYGSGVAHRIREVPAITGVCSGAAAISSCVGRIHVPKYCAKSQRVGSRNASCHYAANRAQWLVDLPDGVRAEWLHLLPHPEAGADLANELPKIIAAEKVAEKPNACSTEEMNQPETEELKEWDSIGRYFGGKRTWHDAIAVYSSLYDHVLRYQMERDCRAHKGRPLVWMAQCFYELGNMPLSKRHLRLTLVEDALTKNGNVDPTKTGSYFRLAWWLVSRTWISRGM